MFRRPPTACRSPMVVLAAATCKFRRATLVSRRLRGRLALATVIVLFGSLFIFSQYKTTGHSESLAVEVRRSWTQNASENAREFHIVIVDGDDETALLERTQEHKEPSTLMTTPPSPGAADRVSNANIKEERSDLTAAATTAGTAASGTAAAADAAGAAGVTNANATGKALTDAVTTVTNVADADAPGFDNATPDAAGAADVRAGNRDSDAATTGSEQFVLLDPEKEQFVYSAHFDDRLSVVHIVGFKHRYATSATRPLWCRYSNSGGEDETLHRMEVHFNVSVFYPRPGLLYNTFVWRCAVKPGVERRPLSVALITGGGAKPVAVLRVEYTPPPSDGEALLQFGVCVKPITNYSNLHQLVEFVEVHRLFGVSKFIIYDHSHSPIVDAALSYYVTAGLVVVHRWHLPVPLETVHAQGQKSMNHHCLMTYMNVIKYIAFIDLDEILVPIAPARTWSDVITAAKLSPGSKSTDGGYVFMSSIFPSEITNYTGLDCNSSKQPCKMATMVNRIRSDIYPVGSWSKPLVETRKAALVDIHVVRRMMPNYTALEVSPDVAFIHHYRANVPMSGGLSDFGAEQFRDEIIREVGQMFAKFSPRAANVA